MKFKKPLLLLIVATMCMYSCSNDPDFTFHTPIHISIVNDKNESLIDSEIPGSIKSGDLKFYGPVTRVDTVFFENTYDHKIPSYNYFPESDGSGSIFVNPFGYIASNEGIREYSFNLKLPNGDEYQIDLKCEPGYYSLETSKVFLNKELVWSKEPEGKYSNSKSFSIVLD
jgi:hypothetical protein